MDRTQEEIHDICGMACEILTRTKDGDDLAILHLKILEGAVNGVLSEPGMDIFRQVHRDVMAGTYRQPWLHGVENVTLDHQGYVLYRGNPVEHFSFRYALSEESREYTREIGMACRSLEESGTPPSFQIMSKAIDEYRLSGRIPKCRTM